MTWQVASDASWLTATLANGKLTLTADPAGLPVGIYDGYITITVNSKPALPAQKLSVTLLVGDETKLLGQQLYLPAVKR